MTKLQYFQSCPMADLKTYMPHIRRAVVANAILITYLLSPSFLSFLAIVVAVFAVTFESPCQSFKSLLSCQDECSFSKCCNDTFEKFKKLTVLEQLVLLVLLKLTIDFSWLIPTWVILILGTQVFAVWNLLRQVGVIKLAQDYAKLAHQSVQKVVALIPRYQPK